MVQRLDLAIPGLLVREHDDRLRQPARKASHNGRAASLSTATARRPGFVPQRQHHRHAVRLLIYPTTGPGVTGDSAITTDANNVLSIVGSTVTANDPVLSLAQTWNKGSVTFTALNLTVTNTASAAASLLMALTASSTSEFTVDESGDVTANGYVNAVNANKGYELKGNYGIGFPSADTTQGHTVEIGKSGGTGVNGLPASAAYASTYLGGSIGLLMTTAAIDNVGIGHNALSGLTSGYANTAIGSNACGYLSTGYQNTCAGQGAINELTTGCCSVAIGDASLKQQPRRLQHDCRQQFG